MLSILKQYSLNISQFCRSKVPQKKIEFSAQGIMKLVKVLTRLSFHPKIQRNNSLPTLPSCLRIHFLEVGLMSLFSCELSMETVVNSENTLLYFPAFAT